MNQAPKPLPSRPAPLATLPVTVPAAAAPPTQRWRMPLGLAGLMLGVAAVLLAAASAYGLTRFARLEPAWAAALAAALGAVAAGLPLAALTLRLARAAAGQPPAAAANPVAGIARPLFLDLAGREWARARRYGSGAALLLVDIDRHARLVEARGPAAGDAVLDELLRQTAPTLRPADMLTRFSATQMAVLLAHADATGALDVAERIRERAEQLELIGATPTAPAAGAPAGSDPPPRLRVTVSIGVAHLRPAHLNLQALLTDGEDAVVAARQAGGNCVRSAPVEAGASRAGGGGWRGDDRRTRPTRPTGPKQGGSSS